MKTRALLLRVSVALVATIALATACSDSSSWVHTALDLTNTVTFTVSG